MEGGDEGESEEQRFTRRNMQRGRRGERGQKMETEGETKAKCKQWREESPRGKEKERFQDDKWKEEDLERIGAKTRWKRR